jgi:serine/tyrosine/threonine adenylyltransferase
VPDIFPTAFDNSYARLPDRFFARLVPVPVAAPTLIRVNRPLAERLGIDPDILASPEGVAMLAGNQVPQGAAPLAMAYAGHQFGNFVPQLGDGRAILLGEVIGRDGVRRDIQLKGAGRTPFSRGGDGRAALGPVLREYIVSEAMAALGIPTTRALAAVTTGEPVLRESPLPGAIFARVARSHVRIGTFEFFRARGDTDGIRALADYVIARHYPQAAQAEQPYQALLLAVIEGIAKLIAQWQLVGFIHGVMNTDNMSIAAETIDYGPCAFMDSHHPETVYSSIDLHGRYAYRNQPGIAHWNLVRLAECLLPLLAEDTDAGIALAHAALDTFPTHFATAYQAGLRRKLGLFEAHEGDLTLAQELLELMAEQGADFTLTFRRLSDPNPAATRALFADAAAFDSWLTQWRERVAHEPQTPAERTAAMRAANPAFIPRNHRIQAAIEAAQQAGDFTKFDELLTVLANPYEDQPNFKEYENPPRPEEVVRQTFCGT